MTGIMQYAYTGDVKKLKSTGYTFQKLYAANYKCYHQNDIFMYVTTQMVLEVQNVRPQHQAALISFIIDNTDKPETFWTYTKPMGKFGDWTMDEWHLTNHGRVLGEQEQKALWLKDNAELWNYIKVNPKADRDDTEFDAVMKRRNESEGGPDPYHIRIPFVQQVLALHALHPLELIESQWTQ